MGGKGGNLKLMVSFLLVKRPAPILDLKTIPPLRLFPLKSARPSAQEMRSSVRDFGAMIAERYLKDAGDTMSVNEFEPIAIAPLPPNSDLSDFVVRLEPADIRARFGHPVDQFRIAALLAPAGGSYRPLAAWMTGSLVGTALLVDLGDGIFELAVLIRSDMKQRRIGTGLARWALLEAESLNASCVIAHVSADNRAARVLVRSAGFAQRSGNACESVYVRELCAKPQSIFAHAVPLPVCTNKYMTADASLT
jgi:RimJ/RimL family protein N-acetyltransferase